MSTIVVSRWRLRTEDGGRGKRPERAVCEVAVALCSYIISM
jgi:hypothetical protein